MRKPLICSYLHFRCGGRRLHRFLKQFSYLSSLMVASQKPASANEITWEISESLCGRLLGIQREEGLMLCVPARHSDDEGLRRAGHPMTPASNDGRSSNGRRVDAMACPAVPIGSGAIRSRRTPCCRSCSTPTNAADFLRRSPCARAAPQAQSDRAPAHATLHRCALPTWASGARSPRACPRSPLAASPGVWAPSADAHCRR